MIMNQGQSGSKGKFKLNYLKIMLELITQYEMEISK